MSDSFTRCDASDADPQMRQARKLEAIGQLAGSVAHDFNNLLTAILGQAELLLEEVPAESAVAASVREIQKAGQSAARLTSQLLAFSRRHAAQPLTITLDEEIARLQEMLTRLIGECVELRVDTRSAARISVEPGLVEQVLLNLVVNARDAMPNGGLLVIGSRRNAAGEVRAVDGLPIAAGRYAVLTVSDTGVGMDTETQARMFEPFFSTKGDAGTGLGLATVHSLVKQHDGFIRVRSAPGCGSTFEVFLPSVAAAPASTCESACSRCASAPQRHGERVLVVEDDQRVRDLVSRALRARGYSVSEAASAEEALQQAAKAPGYDILVTDVVLPRMDGPALAELLRASDPRLCVVFMSGYLHVTLPTEEHFLRKPFTPNDLLTIVQSAIDSGAACAR